MKSMCCFAAGVVAVWMAVAPRSSVACEMPDALIIKQTFLNNKYPNALFVTGATWKLQRTGLLEMPNRERLTATGERFDELERTELSSTLNALGSFGRALHGASRQRHAISLVLVERMHWERFLPEPNKTYDPTENRCYLPCDVKKQRANDLILITSEPALHGMRKGVLSISEAIELGVLRTYGTEEQVTSFLQDFGLIGTHPLETQSQLIFALHDPFMLQSQAVD